MREGQNILSRFRAHGALCVTAPTAKGTLTIHHIQMQTASSCAIRGGSARCDTISTLVEPGRCTLVDISRAALSNRLGQDTPVPVGPPKTMYYCWTTEIGQSQTCPYPVLRRHYASGPVRLTTEVGCLSDAGDILCRTRHGVAQC